MWIPRALSLPSVGWAHGPISRRCDVWPSCCIIFTLVLLYPVWECQPFLMLDSPYFVSFYHLNFFDIYSWGFEILSGFLAVVIQLCLIGNLCWVSGKRQWHPLQYSCLENPMDGGAWWATVHGVAKSRTWLSDFTFTFHFHALEKEMATHSSVLAWRIPVTGKPGGLRSMGSHRVRLDWSDLAAAAAAESLWDGFTR